MRLYTLFVILSFSFIQSASAHALWIETNASGKKGKAQEVRIYFGEYSMQDLSQAGKWFSDLKDFVLIAVAPDGSKSSLASAAAGDHYAASFTPLQEGTYTLLVHHEVKDVYRGMKLDYNSSAKVVVGNTTVAYDDKMNSNPVSIYVDPTFAVKKNNALKVKVMHAGAAAAKQEIKVIAPNGWEKALYTNTNGEASFTPLWPGKYLVEYSFVDKMAGEHNGKPYTELRKTATYAVEVK